MQGWYWSTTLGKFRSHDAYAFLEDWRLTWLACTNHQGSKLQDFCRQTLNTEHCQTQSKYLLKNINSKHAYRVVQSDVANWLFRNLASNTPSSRNSNEFCGKYNKIVKPDAGSKRMTFTVEIRSPPPNEDIHITIKMNANSVNSKKLSASIQIIE